MKHILEFEIPEESDSLREHVNGPKYYTVIWDLLQDKLRPICKHGILPDGYKSEEVLQFAEELREYIYNALNEEGVGSDF